MNGPKNANVRGFDAPVRNRDVLLLSQTLYIVQQISCLEQKRIWQQDRLYSITRPITGMPGGGGSAGLEAQLACVDEDAVAEIRKRKLARWLARLMERDGVGQ